MNTKEFLKQIRQIIREEVRSAVEAEFNVLLESLDKTAKKINNPILEKAESTQVRPKFNPKKSNVTYSSNPLINDILSSTAEKGFSSKDFHGILEEDYNPVQLGHNDFDEWPTMRNMSNMNMTSAGTINAIPKTDIDGRPVTEVAPEVEQALTRDYTSLMKAINKKKGA